MPEKKIMNMQKLLMLPDFISVEILQNIQNKNVGDGMEVGTLRIKQSSLEWGNRKQNQTMKTIHMRNEKQQRIT